MYPGPTVLLQDSLINESIICIEQSKEIWHHAIGPCHETDDFFFEKVSFAKHFCLSDSRPAPL